MNGPAREESAAPPKVSVITPLYNSVAFIRGTLDGLLAQSYANWESILVDDGSTDDTAEVVRPYLEDARFRYVRQENRGIAGARNTGILASAGEWVCLLDHDDRWLPSKLEKQVAYAGSHDCDIVFTDAFFVDGDVRLVFGDTFPGVADELRRAERGEAVDFLGLFLRRLNFMSTSSVMLRRSLFVERGLLDPAAAPADDYEMWLRCMPEAKVGFVGEPLVEYIRHSGNHSRDEKRMIERVIYVLWKHRRRHEREPARARQFDRTLLTYYGALFTKLVDEGAHAEALRHAAALLSRGRSGTWIFSKTVAAPYLRRLRNSIQYRLGLTRPR